MISKKIVVLGVLLLFGGCGTFQGVKKDVKFLVSSVVQQVRIIAIAPAKGREAPASVQEAVCDKDSTCVAFGGADRSSVSWAIDRARSVAKNGKIETKLACVVSETIPLAQSVGVLQFSGIWTDKGKCEKFLKAAGVSNVEALEITSFKI